MVNRSYYKQNCLNVAITREANYEKNYTVSYAVIILLYYGIR